MQVHEASASINEALFWISNLYQNCNNQYYTATASYRGNAVLRFLFYNYLDLDIFSVNVSSIIWHFRLVKKAEYFNISVLLKLAEYFDISGRSRYSTDWRVSVDITSAFPPHVFLGARKKTAAGPFLSCLRSANATGRDFCKILAGHKRRLGGTNRFPLLQTCVTIVTGHVTHAGKSLYVLHYMTHVVLVHRKTHQENKQVT